MTVTTYTGSNTFTSPLVVQEPDIARFDPANATTLTTAYNIIVKGGFEALPNNSSIIHTVQFTGINEAGFVGGTPEGIIKGATQSGTTATYEAGTPHLLTVGMKVIVSGMTPAGYNGTWTVSALPDAKLFQAVLSVSGLGLGGEGEWIAGIPTGPLSAASQSGAIATFTTSAAHGLFVNDFVTIAGMTPAGYNGDWIVLSTPTTTTFTANLGVSGLGNGSGGTFKLFIPASDVGLWVVVNGYVNLVSSPKTTWARAVGTVGVGVTNFQIDRSDANWTANDELVIVPTAPIAVDLNYSSMLQQHEQVMAAAGTTGSTVVLNSATTPDFVHPTVSFNGKNYSAEVINLTRNVRIWGTAGGRFHSFIRANNVQTIRYVDFKFCGPQKLNSQGVKEGVLGRYPLHFHHCMDGSAGSVVEGTVVRHSGSRAFATHDSNNILVKDCATFDVNGQGYWWDEDDTSSFDTFDRCIAALNYALKDQTTFGRAASFTLGHTEFQSSSVINCVVVGQIGGDEAAGYTWPQVGSDSGFGNGVWIFRNNLAHNCRKNGLFVWQNGNEFHGIEGFDAYHCGKTGIEHGAYDNRYEYSDVNLFKNGRTATPAGEQEGQLFDHANSARELTGPVFPEQNNNRHKFVRTYMDGGGITAHALSLKGRPLSTWNEGDPQVLYLEPVLTGYATCPIRLQIFDPPNNRAPFRTDFVRARVGTTLRDLLPEDFRFYQFTTVVPFATDNTLIRIQRMNNSAYQLRQGASGTPIIVEEIAQFYVEDGAPPPPPSPVTVTGIGVKI